MQWVKTTTRQTQVSSRALLSSQSYTTLQAKKREKEQILLQITTLIVQYQCIETIQKYVVWSVLALLK